MNKFKAWIIDVFNVCKREFHLASRDMGVMLFFLALPIVYPILYTLIYNREYVHDVPVVVVDDCRSTTTREYARRLDASQYAHVIGYAANMQEARQAMAQKDCYAIVHFPEDFEECIGRGETAHLPVYCDMSLLLRYKSILMAQTDVTASISADIQAEVMQIAAMQGLSADSNGFHQRIIIRIGLYAAEFNDIIAIKRFFHLVIYSVFENRASAVCHQYLFPFFDALGKHRYLSFAENEFGRVSKIKIVHNQYRFNQFCQNRSCKYNDLRSEFCIVDEAFFKIFQT